MATIISVLDLAFAMDCTSSMGAYIKSATDNIRAIVDEIVAKEKITMRLALIEYRDHPPQDVTFVTRVHSFTNNVTEMKGWLNSCTAQGGGDAPEAVADALNDALNLPWRSDAAKICILISDAPPHGLNPSGDSFPGGCPAGFDPLAIVRKMAEKSITLYTVGVEPPIVPYRDFFTTLAHLTGGQYVPMVDATKLAQMIIAGVREEISLNRLMSTAKKDIKREIRESAANGIDDQETATRLQQVFSKKKMYVNRMKNTAGTPSKEAEECYTKCVDMSDMQQQYKMVTSVTTTKPTDLDYTLEEETTVSLAQAKRIVQKAKNWDYSADEQLDDENRLQCKYGLKCYDHSERHRAKYSHPQDNNHSTRRQNETKTNDHYTRRSEKTSSRGNETRRIECKYGAECHNHNDDHRSKYLHTETDDSSTQRQHETKRNERNTHRSEKTSYRGNETRSTDCKYGAECHNHNDDHRSKYLHPETDDSSTQRQHETKRNERNTHRSEKTSYRGNETRSTECRYGRECHDYTDYHRSKFSHPRDDDDGGRKKCKYGKGCHDFSDSHRTKFTHLGDSDKRPECQYGLSCYDFMDSHRAEYSHPKE